MLIHASPKDFEVVIRIPDRRVSTAHSNFPVLAIVSVASPSKNVEVASCLQKENLQAIIHLQCNRQFSLEPCHSSFVISMSWDQILPLRQWFECELLRSSRNTPHSESTFKHRLHEQGVYEISNFRVHSRPTTKPFEFVEFEAIPSMSSVVIERNAVLPGPDVEPMMVEIDEIKKFLDCRFISASEAAWRILEIDINFRDPKVERLPFHLEDEQQVYFDDDDNPEEVVDRESIKKPKFLQ